ncbi:ABC transporter substrate-binding protein [Marasmitruncus massiliensis]|uniref:ABC transporter substrate-binding protein n=1 Tax=Marasmitruncus massiliensis TaxID=1944642 RepID=UPI000C7E3DC6|nr:ABC transporter substrate-binding protein [Marasmitruncus massiliensis]
MKRILAVLVTCTLLLTTACASGSSGRVTSQPEAGASGSDSQTAQPKTVVIGAQSDLITLDPGNMYEPYANMISYAAYDMLYRVKSGTMGTPEPSVATEVTIDDTKTVYTFKLRDDVVFASGNKLTSKDVAWSVNRVLNMKDSNAYSNVKNVSKVEAPDDYTVVFTLAEPDASFLVKLTSNAFCILDSEVVKQHGGSDSGSDTAKTWLDTTSAGSGPYVIKSWTPKEQLVLEKNSNYWGTASNIDTIILKEMPSVDAQITALQNGEIDIALGLNSETAKQLEGKEGITISNGATALMTFLVMSRDQSLSPEMSNPKVQEAVRYALDYEGYLTLGGEGCTIPLNFVQDGFSGALTRDSGSRDLEKAKALMAEAGYADGFDITLTCANNNSEGLEWSTIAQKVKQDLAEININVNIETLEATLVYEKMRDASMPLYVMFWSPDYYDINNQFAFLPGTGEDGTAYGNRTKWELTAENQPLWNLANKIQTETDPDKRAQYSEELQKLFDQDNPFAFLLQHPKTFAYNSNTLDNVTYNDLCKIQLCDLTAK